MPPPSIPVAGMKADPEDRNGSLVGSNGERALRDGVACAWCAGAGSAENGLLWSAISAHPQIPGTGQRKVLCFFRLPCANSVVCPPRSPIDTSGLGKENCTVFYLGGMDHQPVLQNVKFWNFDLLSSSQLSPFFISSH